MTHRVLRLVEDMFFPTERNTLVPLLLSRRAFLIFAIFGLLLSSPFYTKKIPFASLVQPLIFPASDVVSLANQARTQAGLGALVENAALARAAEAKAEDMLARDYFSHDTPDGKEPWVFLAGENYTFSAAGENLAADFFSATEAHRALMESHTHRANILNGIYREIGVAVKSGEFQGNQSIVVVQFFGTPRQATATLTKTVENTDVKTRPVQVLGRESIAAITQRLARGSSGEEVRNLQRILAEDKEIYPERIVSGYFGSLTEKAVQRFQQKYGIVSAGSPATTGFGVVGARTKAKLFEVYAGAIAQYDKQKTLGDSIEFPREAPFASAPAIVASAMILFLLSSAFAFLIVRRSPLHAGVVVRFAILILVFGTLLMAPQDFRVPTLASPAIQFSNTPV